MSLCDAKSAKNQEIPHVPARTNERGSIIVWIFVMVALLGALYFTFSSGFRSGETQLSKERADLIVTEILDYTEALRRATQELRINGCKFGDGGLTFYSDQFANASEYDIPNSPIDKSCHVFHPNGGGITWLAPPPILKDIGYTEYVIAGSRGILGFGQGISAGNDGIDLTVRVGVTRDICLAINDRVGAPNPSGNPPFDNNGNMVTTPGNGFSIYGVDNVNAGRDGFLYHYYIGNTGHVTELANHATACYENEDDGTFEFYSLLAAR
jgi:hypothetical protein